MIKQLGAFTCIVTIALVCSTGIYAQTEEFIPEESIPAEFVPNELAEAADIANLANETGLPVKSVEEAIAFQHAFTEYADALLAHFPDQISAVWMEPVPNTRGHIQFTQDVPPEALPEAILEIEDIESKGSLLNLTNVVLTGGGMISMADHMRRAELAAEALVDAGYRNHVTFFDPIDAVIQIEVKVLEETARPSTLDVRDAVQNRVLADRDQRGEVRLQGRAATVDASDLELTVMTGPGPIMEFTHSRGGHELRHTNGTLWCTSGFKGTRQGVPGIVTAAHCDVTSGGQMTVYVQPGVAPYSMTPIFGHLGSLGDARFYTTPHIEFAQFHTTPTLFRNVTGTRATNTMVGGPVYVYGRATNVSRNHTVTATGVSVTFGGGIGTIGNLARTDQDTVRIGDSGGPFYWGNNAWGTTVGRDEGAGVNYFSPIQNIESFLSLTINTQ